MKTVDVKPSSYIDFDVENDEKDPKFEVDNHVKYQNIKAFLRKVLLQFDPKIFL